MYALAGLDPLTGKAGAAPAAAACCSSGGSIASSEKAPNLPAAALKLAPPKAAKKPSMPALKPAVISKPSMAASSALPSLMPACGGSSVLLGTHGWFKDIKFPYDPAHPNEYSQWLMEEETKRKAQELEAALEHKQAETSRKLASLAAPGPPPSQPPLAPPPPPPLPPASFNDDAPAKRQKVMPSPPLPPAPQPPSFDAASALPMPPASGGVGGASSSSLSGAHGEEADPGLSMLQKMGWSEGQGLGKDGQGMKTPLMAKKADGATGVIVNAAPRLPPPPPPSQPPADAAAPAGGAKSAVTFRGRPSRVLMLKNMVGAGEVDEDLSAEIGEECSKCVAALCTAAFAAAFAADSAAESLPQLPWTPLRTRLTCTQIRRGDTRHHLRAAGGRTACLPGRRGRAHLRQVCKAGVPLTRLTHLSPPRSHHRFTSCRSPRNSSAQAAAMKAYIDLDGRFFGGRHVSVAFYAEVDFEAGVLAPSKP